MCCVVKEDEHTKYVVVLLLLLLLLALRLQHIHIGVFSSFFFLVGTHLRRIETSTFCGHYKKTVLKFKKGNEHTHRKRVFVIDNGQRRHKIEFSQSDCSTWHQRSGKLFGTKRKRKLICWSSAAATYFLTLQTAQTITKVIDFYFALNHTL